MNNHTQYVHNDYDWLLEKNIDWDQNDQNDWVEEDWCETEYRVDPYDFKLYTREEFYEYYGRYLEWNIQDPRLIIRRNNIDYMISRYKNILYLENINYLVDKMIETFI
jgi:hypothetical protein